MANKKAKDPKVPVTVSVPRSLIRTSKAVARAKRISFSEWVTGLIREYFQQVEKDLR